MQSLQLDESAPAHADDRTSWSYARVSMPRTVVGLLSALSVLLLGVATPAASQPNASTAVSMTHRPVSPTVWATTAFGSSGSAELIVLWRGRPGWFAAGGPRADHSGGNASSFYVQADYGTTHLELSYDRQRHRATIHGVEVPFPAGTNTILVDNVDQQRGPTVSGFATLTIPDAATHPTLAEMFRQSPRAVAFLQCNAPWAREPRFVALNGLACDELVAR